MILALDIATQTGWCAGIHDGQPKFGHFRVAYDGKTSAAKFALNIDRLIKSHGIKFVYFEQPVMGSGDKKFANYKSKRLLFGLTHTTEAVAQLAGCRVFEVPIATWRKHFLGHAHLRRDDANRAALTRCKQLGYRPDNDDEASAIGIWDYACALHSRVHAWQTSPLAAASRPTTTGDDDAR